MKKIYSVSFLLLTCTCFGQLDPAWEADTDLITNAADVRLLEDHEGNLVVVRMASFIGELNYGIGINKYNPAGELLWSLNDENIEDQSNISVFDVALDAENNIYVAGTELSSEDLFSHCSVVRIGADGDVEWSTDVTGLVEDNETLGSIVVNPDGQVFVSGWLFDYDYITLNHGLVKLDAASGAVLNTYFDGAIGYGDLVDAGGGNLHVHQPLWLSGRSSQGAFLWMTSLSYPDQDILLAEVSPEEPLQLMNNGNLVSANIYSTVEGEERIGIKCLLPSGVESWVVSVDVNETIGTEVLSRAHFTIGEDNRIYVAGYYEVPAISNAVFMICVEPEGDIAWNSHVGNTSDTDIFYPEAIGLSSDGIAMLFCTGGATTSPEMVIKGFSMNGGAMLWTYTEENNINFTTLSPRNVVVSSSGEIYVAGAGWGETSERFFLSKYATAEGIPLSSHTELKTFPNPASDFLGISAGTNFQQIEIFDSQGRRVTSVKGINTSRATIRVGELQNGIYIVSINGPNLHMTSPFIKN